MLYECPWCTQKTFSFWEKQTLGPNKTIPCRSCNRKVGVPWDRAQVAAAPLVALCFLGLIVGKVLFGTLSAVLLFGWVGASLGFLVTAPLYHFYVPLEKPQ